MVKSKHIPYYLVLLSILFLGSSQFGGYLGVFVFFGLAPLFGIYELKGQKKIDFGKFAVLILASLVIGFLLWEIMASDFSLRHILEAGFYGVLMSCSFIIYSFTDTYAKNRIGYFTILIYWLTLEYCAFLISPSLFRFSLANGLLDLKGWIKWTLDTGILGLSVWVILGNILFYYVFYKGQAIFKKQFRWRSLIYTLFLLSIPILISQYAYNESVETTSSAIVQYAGNNEIALDYKYAQLEYLGKTATWVSVMIISYAIVKSFVKR